MHVGAFTFDLRRVTQNLDVVFDVVNNVRFAMLCAGFRYVSSFIVLPFVSW